MRSLEKREDEDLGVGRTDKDKDSGSWSKRKEKDLISLTALHISDSFKCSKKADPVFELARLGLFGNYRFISIIFVKLGCKVV